MNMFILINATYIHFTIFVELFYHHSQYFERAVSPLQPQNTYSFNMRLSRMATVIFWWYHTKLSNLKGKCDLYTCKTCIFGFPIHVSYKKVQLDICTQKHKLPPYSSGTTGSVSCCINVGKISPSPLLLARILQAVSYYNHKLGMVSGTNNIITPIVTKKNNNWIYHQTFNIMRTKLGKEIVYHSDVIVAPCIRFLTVM